MARSVYRLLGAEVPQGRGERERGRGGERKDGEEQTLNTAFWDEVAMTLKRQNPEYSNIQIADGRAVVKQQSAPNGRASDQYQFDSGTGEITKTELYTDTAKASRIFGWSYALHVGDFWGIWSKILAFAGALIGASLPVTGYWMYIKRKIKSSKKRQRLVLD